MDKPVVSKDFIEYLDMENIQYEVCNSYIHLRCYTFSQYEKVCDGIHFFGRDEMDEIKIELKSYNASISIKFQYENSIYGFVYSAEIITDDNGQVKKYDYNFLSKTEEYTVQKSANTALKYLLNIKARVHIFGVETKSFIEPDAIYITFFSYQDFKKSIDYIQRYSVADICTIEIQENNLDASAVLRIRATDTYNKSVNVCTNTNGVEKDHLFKSDYQTAIYDFIKKYTECFFSTIHSHKTIAQYENIIPYCIENLLGKKCIYMGSNESVEMQITKNLMDSEYFSSFEKKIDSKYSNYILAVNYTLPSIDNFPKVKQYKYIKSENKINITKFSDSQIAKMYDVALYSICLRTIAEIFSYDKSDIVKSVVFNGYVTATNRSTGNIETKCIITIQVLKEKFLEINLQNVDPKQCFKSLKGVSAAKLSDIAPVVPLLAFDKTDKRFVASQSIKVDNSINLASMQWEDFEHLIRELFEKEFSINGGEVKVTQASRDGGVDAIAFDPDPIRGGKIVIQAKRYTNTVGVSAVRDLYGTVMNEGANKGILVTTSDYGADSYDFAKDKPLTLLNGGHILHLLEKHGQKARIDIAEAKKRNTI